MGKPVDQKVPKGVDPKSVLCNFFKQGQCSKGNKCKFSHDLNIERKAEKRNIYESEDTMDKWDEQKLEEVINKKHGESNKKKMTTTIICKYFLEAVENNKYGWFWACPTGEGCHYKHVLPPGFVLKKDKKKEEKVDEISLEDLIETERAALNSSNLTKIDINSFLAWKERKRKEKIAKRKKETDKKKNAFKDGQTTGISGREMFEFNPDMIKGGDDEVKVTELTLESLAESAKPEGIVKDAPTQRQLEETVKPQAETVKLDEAAGATANPEVETDAAIDENLFDGEDLDLIEDELEELDL